jgi:hypothetical protein
MRLNNKSKHEVADGCVSERTLKKVLFIIVVGWLLKFMIIDLFLRT